MTKKLLKMVLAASLALMHAGAPAEDIDLFVKGAVPASQRPNVLIVLDNTANWNTAFENEKSALVSLMQSLPADKFNVGLMLFTESGGGNGNPGGAYVRAAVRPMDASNKGKYQELFESLDQTKDKGNNAAFGSAMAEAYRYFSGTEAFAGHNKVKRDHAGNSVPSYPKSNAVYALPGNAFSSAASTTYVSPAAGGCQDNFIIFISNGASDLGENSGDTVKNLLAAAGGNTTEIALSPSGRQVIVSDEWARFMANNDVNASVPNKQTVVTYTLDVNPSSTGQGPSNTALLRSMASQGRGSYFAVSSANGGEKIADALVAIFSEIQAVDTAFASASLPVSVNTQGAYLNQIFIGMFRPDETPRWYGNLKQYQFRAEADADGKVVALKLADKNNFPAINSQNGFITPCASSYWSTTDTYWPNGYLGNCTSSDKRSNAPDGEIVEKGGAAQRLRALSASSARNVKTCSSCGDSSALADFSTSTASNTAFGVTTDAERSALINWARGQNVDDEMSKGTTAMRPSAHGDVVHSRPLAIDYGGSTGVVVYYGGNDGMLRAINGNKPDSAGNELWSFVAPEHYGKFKRLRSNTPAVKFPNAPTSAEPKDYFFDGSIGAYREGTDKVWIYPTMRRGGRMVYAFNVTSPSSPTLKWKRGCPNLGNDTGCSDGFSAIGQTWSEPKVVKVVGYPSLAAADKSPVIVMGGGYDACEDADVAPNTTCTSTKGNRIFVLNADTGAVLKTFSTDRAVPADVTAVDSDGDGYVDIAYAVDTGANIYRINIGESAPSGWTINKIAAFGCSSAASCDRKFLYAPEVVVRANFNAVLVGSGNRERPLEDNQAVNVDNGFFMVKDYREATPSTLTTGDLVAIDPDAQLTDAQETALASTTNKGWYLNFGSNSNHDKEQVVTSAVVVAGVAYFSTHIPTKPEDCGDGLGSAFGYAVSFLDGSGPNGNARFDKFAGGGLPPSPVTGVVLVPLTGIDGEPLLDAEGKPVTASVPFIIGGTGAPGGPGENKKCGFSGIDSCSIDVETTGVRGRVYWYIDTKQP